MHLTVHSYRLHVANKSQIAEQAIELISQLYVTGN